MAQIPDDLLHRLRERAAEARLQYPCVEDEGVASAERDLGFRLPRLLRAVYLSVANGGFGPGFGLIGLESGATHEDGQNLVELYQQGETSPFDRDRSEELWPEKVLPLCSYGCGIFSCVDCSRRSARVLFFDPNKYWRPKLFRLESRSLAEWFTGWLDGLSVEERIQEAADRGEPSAGT